MIQRIQTIWLLLATICIFLTMHFPTYTGNSKDDIPYAILNGKYNALFTIFTSGVGVAILITIFLFKNRKLQFRINLFTIFLLVGLLIYYFFEANKFVGMGNLSFVGTTLHIATFTFLILSLKGILADNKIIKDSDRLR